jgi:hypothetical protein
MKPSLRFASLVVSLTAMTLITVLICRPAADGAP